MTMEQNLLDTFKPIVLETARRWPFYGHDHILVKKALATLENAEYKVVHQETCELAIIYIMHIRLAECTARELIDVATILESFCGYEEDPIEVEGLRFQIGDGDDYLAVMFSEGEFKIWIRHFKYEGLGL